MIFIEEILGGTALILFSAIVGIFAICGMLGWLMVKAIDKGDKQ